MPVSDLRSSLYLNPLPVHYFGSDGRDYHVWRLVYKIPYYTFGRLVGFENISLYFLFPRLSSNPAVSGMRTLGFKGTKYSYLRSTNITIAPFVQYYPSSFDHSRLNTTARGVEIRS